MAFIKTAFGRRTLALLAAGLAVLFVVLGGATWMAARTRSFAQSAVLAQHARADAFAVLATLQDAETGQRGYLLTGDDAYLEPFSQAEARITEDLHRLAGDSTDPALRPLIDRLGQASRAKLAELAETVALARQGQRAQAMEVVHTDRGKALMDQARGLLATITSRLDARLSADSASIRRNGAVLFGVLAAGAALMLAVAAAGILVVLRYTRDLDEARRAVEHSNEQLEERVRERTASLEEANEEVQRFAYIVSHDLRAPLVNIMGFTSELEVGLGALQTLADAAAGQAPHLLTDEARAAIRDEIPEALGFIRSSTGRMDRLINAILRISREGRRQLLPERIDMEQLFDRLGRSVAHQLAEMNGSLTVETPMPAVLSDRLALEQVFGNLIDNAVKYLDPARPGRIVVRGRRERRSLIYEVADNGRGIASADFERVFELFRRSGAQDRPGEGIGLAHVRALLRRCGGSISCHSALGTGSIFRVALPMAPAFQDSPHPGIQDPRIEDREIAQ